MSTLELIKAPGVAMVLLLYGHVMLLGLAYTAGLLLSSLHPRSRTISTDNRSHASILVHRACLGRLRIDPTADFVLHRRHWSLSSNLASLCVPDPPTPLWHRRRITRLSLHVADFLCCCACLQLLPPAGMDDCVLDHRTRAADWWQRSCYGFQCVHAFSRSPNHGFATSANCFQLVSNLL